MTTIKSIINGNAFAFNQSSASKLVAKVKEIRPFRITSMKAVLATRLTKMSHKH